MARDERELASELLRRVKRLEIRTSHLADDLFAGSYKSVFRGRGMEFSEVRRYYAGDPVNSIDWNVTARVGYPHVKVHVDERELTVLLVVDASGSVEFGSGAQTKQETAAEVAGLLAFSALRNNDKVGLMMFTDEVEKYLAPDTGRKQATRIIRELLHHKPQQRGTNIAEALEMVSRVLKRRAIVFLISDFHDDAYLRPMAVAAKRHDLVAVRLVDPLERELPAAGLVEVVDAETGDHYLVDTSGEEMRSKYAGLLEDRRAEQDAEMLRRGVDVVRVDADTSAVDALVRFFDLRSRRIA